MSGIFRAASISICDTRVTIMQTSIIMTRQNLIILNELISRLLICSIILFIIFNLFLLIKYYSLTHLHVLLRLKLINSSN